VGDLDAFITGLSGATTKPPAQPGASKQAERIAAIVETVRALGYDPQNIPYGGKSIIERECLKSAKLFTPSTFKTAWQSARNAGRIEVENAETYRGQ
jgi:hypothetical protein